MLVLAHAGHLLVNLIYAGPVILIVAWISVQSFRERRREKRAGGHSTSREDR